MSVSLNGTNGLTFADSTTQNTGGYTGFRNRIINGAMMIDQRNAGASVTMTSGLLLADRWKYLSSQSSKFNGQQNQGSVTPPTGCVNYLGLTTSSAVTVGASDYFSIVQRIEGLNVADLGFGTANAATVTLSFWVRSSLTGTFGGSLRNDAGDRSYPFTYTISVANTWEQKTITIAGDTTGTWLKTNGTGIEVGFSLGMGSSFSGTAGSWASGNYLSATGATSIVGTNGATFYITGVQLEKGSVATPFEHRPYGTELALCQRYYERITSLVGNGPSFPCFMNSTTIVDAMVHWLVQKRATPTISGSNGTNHFVCEIGNAGFAMNAFLGAYQPSQYGARCRFQFNSGSSTIAYAGHVTVQNTSAYIDASAEL